MQPSNSVVMEFHVSRDARDRFGFSEALFSLSGNVVIANFQAARAFAQKMNDHRDLVHFPERAVKAGHLNAMGLIDEILHFVIGLYRQENNPDVMAQALDWLHKKYSPENVDKALRRFIDQFPPAAVYKGEIDPAVYLSGATAGTPHRQVVLEEMLMLWLANRNPAFAPFLELFDDSVLSKETAYREIAAGLHEFFETQPVFGPDGQNLVEMLRSPAVVVPNSLPGQLAYILEKWGFLKGNYFYRLLVGQDLLKEEEKGGFPGPGPVEVYQFNGQELEPERFSPDRDWMPRLVLLAKNIYVWLDQMTRKYRRSIRTLDQVPDEELEVLARWGFSGLWLIGLWERSRASQKIKQLCGNPEAAASAYSLADYDIAGDLGGEPAFQNLKERAWRRGIRLASDMVPNHMGIDSRWVIEHPDWFIRLDQSPFPSYRFSGPDLSSDERVGVFLEDHYYTRSDAAVVFKRVDRRTGSETYIYHGNDGTSMPWNDTAQLNFLDPRVREGVIQTILHVARKFSIIRFDAAMVLTQKHHQRLWHPEPGGGGAIPSRAEHGLTKEEFEARAPTEFWREVVDCVGREVGDTLLLAEAFWMMEGYFVRTLGMHRVYNSAFMNMLKNEDNANYRSVMKNTLEFNPEILKRFVNFMNNPDEETAEAQFGKGDKYLGVCTLMATLPGLPMFGHGQVEGFTEKYGMEYRRAYRDEQPDEGLVQRHEREIFPLLRRRRLFAEVDNFYLYDLVTADGDVNEDVLAYSNRSGDERALVVYHNKYADTRGWICTSVGYMGKTGTGEERALMQNTLGPALGLTAAEDYFTIFRDQASGLEYIRNNQELFDKGLYVDLCAYGRHVFMDFRQVRDNESGKYAQLAGSLNGRGVPSIDDALWEVFLGPIHQPFKELVNAGFFRQLLSARVKEDAPTQIGELLEEVERKMVRLLHALKQFGGGDDNASLAREVVQQVKAVLQPPIPHVRDNGIASGERQEAIDYLKAGLTGGPHTGAILFGWIFVHSLGKVLGETDAVQRSRSWLDEWRLGRILAGAFQDLGFPDAEADKAVRLIGLLTTHQQWFQIDAGDRPRAYRVLESVLKDGEGQQFLGVNRFNDIVWYNGEAFAELLSWLFLTAVVQTRTAEEIVEQYRVVRDLRRAAEKVEYQVEKLLLAAKDEPAPVAEDAVSLATGRTNP